MHERWFAVKCRCFFMVSTSNVISLKGKNVTKDETSALP